MPDTPTDAGSPPVPPPPAAPIVSGPPLWVAPLERVLIWVAVISFSAGALFGIALIFGGSAPTEGTIRFLAFLLIAGIFSLTMLAALMCLRRETAVGLGWVGIGASALGFLIGLVVVLSSNPDAGLAKVLAVVTNLATYVTFASLLLLVYRRHQLVDVFIIITVAIFGVLFVVNVIQVFGGLEIEGGMLKLLASLGILSSLGLIATPLLGRLLAPGGVPRAPRPPAQTPPAAY